MFVTYTFVDDIDLVKTAKNNRETLDHIMFQMQKIVDLWVGLICATALVPAKMFWYAIDFTWQDKEWLYAKFKML